MPADYIKQKGFNGQIKEILNNALKMINSDITENKVNAIQRH